MQYCYEYPRPMVTVDIAVFCQFAEDLKVLLIERGHEPFKGFWALPGGYIDMEETLEQSARRELFEETGLKITTLHQWKAYGDPGRDPRGRTITVVFYGFVPPEESSVAGGDDASKAAWFSIKQLPPLAFDHHRILQDLMNHLQV